jgi:arginase
MMIRRVWVLMFVMALLPGGANAQERGDGPVKIALVKMPYSGSRNVAELSITPDYLEAGGLEDVLKELGTTLKPMATVALTEDDEREYGEWHRLGLANGHLAEIVADNTREGYLSVGLLANCSSLMGMLGGMQNAGPNEEPLRVGLVWVDAHGDFNTPETTLSGMLGGMPVAISAGLALHRLRKESGLDPALETEDIVMVGVRDLDPLERELVEQHEIAQISVDDVRQRSEHMHAEMRRLSALTDIIYVHIDMDVLDPAEVPGHGLTVADGPTSMELAAALTEMFRYEKAAALGIASTPSGSRDPDGVSRQAAYNLIVGAVKGAQGRAKGQEEAGGADSQRGHR